LKRKTVKVSGVFNAIYATLNQVIYAVRHIRVFDILDILIIAYIIYKAISFFRESRAGQLVKGIIVLFVVYIIADWWNLVTVQWMLSKVMNSVLLAAVVIFQHELRRILENVGKTKFSRDRFLDNDKDEVSESIDKIAKVAGFMSEKRIGALIVFERTTQLGEIVNTGTHIDAAVSVSIVNNIFFPKSPLHDGAMIIREGRILAAGCILPLTQNDTLSSQLGTRHRAAIGMSENSDAVVLVVSEETGIISIVEGGKITRNYNSVTACTELRRLLIADTDGEKQNSIISVIKSINPFKKRKTLDDVSLDSQDTEEKESTDK
jgi:diadenylate cyclase